MPVFVCVPCEAFFVTREEGQPCPHCGTLIQEANPAEVQRFFERLKRHGRMRAGERPGIPKPGSGDSN